MLLNNLWWNKKGIVLGIVLLSITVSQILQAAADTSAVKNESAGFRVNKIRLIANPIEFNGPCPAEVKFKAKISASGRGTVVCQILRSDNLPAPAFTMKFDHSGTKDTVYSYLAEDNFMGWQQLTTVKPNAMKSNKVEFTVMCKAQ